MTATEQETGGLLADISAKLGFSVELGQEQLAATKKLNATLDPTRMMQPVNFRTQGSAIANAAGVAVIQFSPAGPDQGHLWVVHSLVVGGDTWATTAAGSAELYVSAMDLRTLNGTSPPLTDLVDQAATLPLPATYGDQQVTLRNGEDLYMRIVGGTSGQQYVASARGVDYQEGVRKQTDSI